MAAQDVDIPEGTSLDPSEDDAGASVENGSQESASYKRSTIRFPYSSLQDAELVVRHLHRDYGGSASPDQIAASMKASPRSGAFRSKLTAAAMFGAVEPSRGGMVLTDLGNRLIDPQTRGPARVEAFLNVPLFAALVDDYKGVVLPPIAGLDRKIQDLGVGAKNATRARQAFQRSAELAGFFRHGKDRLVEPARGPQQPDRPPANTSGAAPAPDQSSRPGELSAPLVELWVTLLRDGGSWSDEKTVEYVEAARRLHELLTQGG